MMLFVLLSRLREVHIIVHIYIYVLLRRLSAMRFLSICVSLHRKVLLAYDLGPSGKPLCPTYTRLFGKFRAFLP